MNTVVTDIEKSIDGILPFPVEDLIALQNTVKMLRRRIDNLPGHNENTQSLAQRLMAACETVAQMASEVGEHGYTTDRIARQANDACEDLEIGLSESHPRSLGQYRSYYPYQP